MVCICGTRVHPDDLADHIEMYHGSWSELRDWIVRLVRKRTRRPRRKEHKKLTPYLSPETRRVVGTLSHEGYRVTDAGKRPRRKEPRGKRKD